MKLRLYDPQAKENFEKVFPAGKNIKYFDKPLDAIKGVSALLILTEWNEVKTQDPIEMYKLMELPVVIDGRNAYDADKMLSLGFSYFPIGKGSVMNALKNNNHK